jgi:apolipoprotein N-acyltransferase
MADRRKHKRAPAKSRVTVRSEDGGRTPRSRRSWGSMLRGLAWLFGPPVASALLLTLAFPPAEVSWLAYVALVPLMVTAVRARTGRDAFFAALAGGIVFFGINLYWIGPITMAGYVAVLPYLGLYWAVWALAMRWLSRREAVPLAVAAPVVWVALEWIRGWALSGLPWLFVGHTQQENLVLIQTADMVGAYGPSALCLATTGLLAAVLVRPLFVPRESADVGKPRPSGLLLANLLVVGVAWAVTVGYGLHRLSEAPQGGGPVVASVQTNVPQEIKLKARLEQVQRLEEQMMQAQLDLTDEALAKAAERGRTVDLVCWPETMVPGILNREYLEADLERLINEDGLRRVFRYLQDRSRRYWLEIHEKAREADVPILFGGHAVEIEGVYRLPGGGYFTRGPRSNTAFLLTPAARRYKADHRYAKCHLVPFGEYVPFKESWPWLHGVLQAFTPYEYDHSLTPGAHDQAPFVIPYGGKDAAGDGAEQGRPREVRFQVAICYEDAMAYRIREMVRADGGMRNAERGMRGAKRNGNESRRDSRSTRFRHRSGQASVASFPQNDIEYRWPLKAVDFIVNISNDGWFAGTWELDQHLNLCVFRAVENRVPIVRSVNTGISAIIQSTGRITRVVEKDGRRRGVSGSIVGEVTLDDRIAPYTVHGDAFAYGCLLATAGIVAAVVVSRLHGRRNGEEETSHEE